MNTIIILLGILIIFLLISYYYLFNDEKRELDENERKKLGGKYIKLSDGITHYKLEGLDEGKLVVLIHGGTVPLWTWDKQIQPLKNAGYKILRYDMYGRGYSDRPNIIYDQALYRRQLIELVDELCLKDSFDLVGCSFGGAIATSFAAQFQNKVRKLILISPLINNFSIPSFIQIPIAGEFITRIIGIKTLTKRFVSLFENSPESEKYATLYEQQRSLKGFQRSLLSMLRNNAISGDYSNYYQKVGEQGSNVLLIWGTEDEEIGWTMINEIRSLIPNLEFKPVEGAGHGILFQKSNIINDFIIEFLSRDNKAQNG